MSLRAILAVAFAIYGMQYLARYNAYRSPDKSHKRIVY